MKKFMSFLNIPLGSASTDEKTLRNLGEKTARRLRPPAMALRKL
jgi:hypothetical protein